MKTKASKGDTIHTIPIGHALVKRRYIDAKGKRWYEVYTDKNPQSTFHVKEDLCVKIIKKASTEEKEPF